jgi:hypothetical protein
MTDSSLYFHDASWIVYGMRSNPHLLARLFESVVYPRSLYKGEERRELVY